MISDVPATVTFVSPRTAIDLQRDRFVSELAAQVRRRLADRRPLSSTYRLQFHRGFTFRDAAGLADYLRELGVSHVYSSPQFAARSGSTHGYDVIDPSRLNPELGSDADATAYRDALRENGLGQILDIVPNHMSVGGCENLWWMDVLTHGPASRFAQYFDIDWQPPRRELEGRVLLPVLGDLYGRVLERGELAARFENGNFVLECPGTRLPLDPKSWTAILECALGRSEPAPEEQDPAVLESRSILTALQHLPARTEASAEAKAERYREAIVIQGRIQRLFEQSPEFAASIERALAEINGIPGQPASFDRLDQLLAAQVYHLVHWKAGSDELNYRRFFDVTELAAICTENLDVFEATHAPWLEAAVAQQVDGFRIDHIDGLFDPEQYLWRLQSGFLKPLVHQEALALAGITETRREELERDVLGMIWSEIAPTPFRSWHASARAEGRSRSESPVFVPKEDDSDERSGVGIPIPLPVVVEKILGRGEALPRSWPVLGTTGYDFLTDLNGLFVAPRGLVAIERHHARFAGVHASVPEIVYQSKRLILSGPMQSEVQLLACRLDRLARRHRLSQDYSLQALRAALRELIANFPFYRTYIARGAVSDEDRRILGRAAADARRRNAILDAELFAFVRDVLLLERPLQLDTDGLQERDLFVGRFQQVTGPVAAKGVEDTFFYRHVPLASLAEVGGDPQQPTTTVTEFHRRCEERQRLWPRSLLATTTHDTKRSEDVRARLSILSEIPGPWRTSVERWSRWNRRHRREVDGEPAPSRADEWLFYQSLLGVWPLETPSDEEWGTLTSRLLEYLQKATHEAKVRTSWINPNSAYDEGVSHFVKAVLEHRQSRFLQDFAAFAESIVDPGLYNSCSQTLLKLLSPGTPDVYQGQEAWDFSLVDPDNRRPVDYAARKEWLADLMRCDSEPEACLALARELASHPRDRRLKLRLVSTALRHRRTMAASEVAYVRCETEGERADHVVAFARVSPDVRGRASSTLVVAPRWIVSLTEGKQSRLPCGDVWGETRIVLPPSLKGPLRDLYTGKVCGGDGPSLRLADLLSDFPVALLSNGSETLRGS